MYLGIFSFHSSASPTSTTPLGKYNKPLSSLSIAQESEKLSLSSAFSGHSSKDCWNVRSFLCSVTPRFEFDTNWMICMVKYSFLYIPIKGQPTLFIYLFIYLTRVTLNSRVTDKPVALEFHVELEFRNVSFWGGRKIGEPGEKTLGARTRTNNKLNPHMTPKSGNRTRATLVGGERSHHCAIPAPTTINKRIKTFFRFETDCRKRERRSESRDIP